MGWSLMIFCARATRGLGRPSLDARSGRSISPHPWKRTSGLGGGGEGLPGRPPARGTRTIRMCSFDARIRGSTRPPFEACNEQARKDGRGTARPSFLLAEATRSEGWEGGLLISCARATRGLRRPSLDKRSGRPIRPPSCEESMSELGRTYISLNARSEGQSGCSP